MSDEFIHERDNFYSNLKEDEEYVNVSMKLYMLDYIIVEGVKEKDYTINEIKTKEK